MTALFEDGINPLILALAQMGAERMLFGDPPDPRIHKNQGLEIGGPYGKTHGIPLEEDGSVPRKGKKRRYKDPLAPFGSGFGPFDGPVPV